MLKRLANAVHCPACEQGGPRSLRSIAYCGYCGHRWLTNSAEEHREVELSVYTDSYVGYRADPVFVDAVRRISIAEFVPRLPAGAAILDVGCGAGDFISAAAALGFDAEGIDISTASATICQERGLKAVAGDFLTHDFGRKFDLITMWDLVEHLREPETFMVRATELLNPGGLIFAKIPLFGGISVGISALAPRLAGMLLGAPDHVQYFTTGSLSAMCVRAGLSPQYLPRTRGVRKPREGGTIRRRIGRRASGYVKHLSGDNNAFLLAEVGHPTQ